MLSDDQYLERLKRFGRALDEVLFYGGLIGLELELRAYNPDQPRVPAGHSAGGRWTSGSYSGSGVDASTMEATNPTQPIHLKQI